MPFSTSWCSPLLAPANFDLQGQSAPTPGPDGRVQLPPNTKINLIMVNSPEGKHYYLGFSDWDAVHAWQKNPEQGRQVIICCALMIYANMVAKNPGCVPAWSSTPARTACAWRSPLIESVKKQKDEIAKALAQQRAAVTQILPGDKVTIWEPSVLPDELARPYLRSAGQCPRRRLCLTCRS